MKRASAVGLLMGLAGCGLFTPKSAPTGNSMPTQTPPQVVIRSSELRATPGVVVTSATLTGTVLELRFRCPGACQDHTFDLVHNGISTRSIPPMMPLFLHHRRGKVVCAESADIVRRYELTPTLSLGVGAVLRIEGYDGQVEVPRPANK